jgi:hypothetical protein
MKPLFPIIAGFLVSGFIFTNFSCTKETDCKAVVRCLDSSGVNRVANATVELFALVKSADGKTTYTSDVRADGISDADGEARFTFKLPAILDIRATLATGTRTLSGAGIIKLEEGKTIEKEVTLR